MSNPSVETLRQMQQIAKRLQQDEQFLASVLSTYQTLEHLSDENLANNLNITQVNMARLALCKRPDTSSPTFANEIRQIASYVQMDPGILANLVRQVENLGEFSKWSSENNVPESNVGPAALSRGLLTAARDRSVEEQPRPENDSDQGKNSEDKKE